MPIILDNGSISPPIGYYVPANSYSIQMSNYSDTVIYLSVFSDLTVFSFYQSQIDTNQIDYLQYDKNGKQFKIFNYDTLTKNYELESIIINPDNEEVYQIGNTSVSLNDTTTFDIQTEDNFKITNEGSAKQYNLTIRFVSENSDARFEHENIAMSKNSAHFITPVWENLQKETLPILIDENLDGTFDDTLYLKNQYIGATPSTKGELKNQNIYFYPNPFNPDEIIGTFRYSLSKAGNVTIKIYDVSGTTVKTVIENEPKEAQTELATPWDGRNDKGQIVANGVYFYVIESSSGERAVGKVAVLR